MKERYLNAAASTFENVKNTIDPKRGKPDAADALAPMLSPRSIGVNMANSISY